MKVQLSFASMVARACGLLLLAGAGYEVVRLARADRLARSGTREAMERASLLDPDNAAYLAALRRFREAAERNPSEAELWIGLGLEAEAARDFVSAERHLLRAALASKKYEPRWTLANFYFRRGRAEPFWQWTGEAIAVSYGDRFPLWDLCWAMTNNEEEIWRRAVAVRDDLRTHYVQYLTARRRWAAAARAARRVEAGGGSLHGTAFDWQAARPRGVEAVPLAPSGNWRLVFDGGQPEAADLLTRLAPVTPGKRAEIRFRYRARSARPSEVSGLRWRVQAAGGEARLLARSGLLASEGEREEVFDFAVPSGLEAVWITLFYERPAGAMRLEGVLELEQCTISEVR